MEEAPENGKELLHSAHVNGMNEWMNIPLIYGIIVKATFQYMWNAVFIGYQSICLYGQNKTTPSLSQDRVMCRHLWKHNIEMNLKETGLLL
jgi:hypothetical protein